MPAPASCRDVTTIAHLAKERPLFGSGPTLQHMGDETVDKLRRRELDDVFLACLREPDLAVSTGPLASVVDPAERAYVGVQAQRHRLFGVLYAQVRSLGWDPTDFAPSQHHLRVVGLQLRLHAELTELGRTLEGLGLPWLTFKGPVLAETAYPRPDLRAYGDIDVLIAPADLRVALDELSHQGLTLYSEPWAELARTERSQLSLLTRRTVPVDLHWHLFNNPRVRRAFPVRTEELLERRQLRSTGRGDLWALDDVDTALHLAAHGAQSGGELLVWVLDLHQAVRMVQDWDELVRRAHRSRLGLVAAVMLTRCQHLLGTDLPDGVVDALAPEARWRDAVSLLDAKRPPHHSVLGTGQLVFTSTRDSTASSALHLGRAAFEQAVLPFWQTSDHPWRVALRGGRPAKHTSRPDVRSASIGADSVGREGFLRYVEQDQQVICRVGLPTPA